MADPQTNQAPVASAVLSIVAGLWMLIGPTWMTNVHWEAMQNGNMMHSMQPWMWHRSIMGSFVAPMGWPWPGVIAGAFVLVPGILLITNPSQRRVWGGIIAASSALVLLTSMGGAVPGAIGIAGGLIGLLSADGTSSSTPSPGD